MTGFTYVHRFTVSTWNVIDHSFLRFIWDRVFHFHQAARVLSSVWLGDEADSVHLLADTERGSSSSLILLSTDCWVCFPGGLVKDVAGQGLGISIGFKEKPHFCFRFESQILWAWSHWVKHTEPIYYMKVHQQIYTNLYNIATLRTDSGVQRLEDWPRQRCGHLCSSQHHRTCMDTWEYIVWTYNARLSSTITQRSWWVATTCPSQPATKDTHCLTQVERSRSLL